MRKTWIVLVAVLLVATAALAVARAVHPHHFGRYCGSPLRVVARELALTDTQQQQIKTIWQTERLAVAALVGELANEQREMNLANEGGKYDEKTMDPIANRQAVTFTKLSMEKEKVISTVYMNVLTPEQRIKADRWRAKWPARLEEIARRIASDEHAMPGPSLP